MLDFANALYLGWRHPAHTLGGWAALTTGQPAWLAEVPGSRRLAAGLARLQGLPAATLCTSSLHLFWDLFGLLAHARCLILFDAACYPVLGWGVERAQGRGARVQRFAAHDAQALARHLQQARAQGWQAVIVSEGFTPALGRFAPLPQYAELAQQYGALLVLDDTQALGLFDAPQAGHPCGVGGGGSVSRFGLQDAPVLVGSSLAKAFGAPLAALAGARELIAEFDMRAATREHSSPPNQAAVNAALRALTLNGTEGEARRQRLWRNLAHWRQGVAQLGLESGGGLFPQQTLLGPWDWADLYRFLRRRGVRSLLRNAARGLSFILNADHEREQIAFVLQLIADWLQRQPSDVYGIERRDHAFSI
ncbi:aminotransferase class I/II-fold pyridoxal phosphate-dependent enzyme [Massilia sp. W12]|uniref:aminotransferase class I/II-fold pyridoxal phosphate-dependent enzyme n=1 Tax=Massilia sp. W12 TaxID=3126507 RepID=UPI0030D09D92